jgi:hypothetical protein
MEKFSLLDATSSEASAGGAGSDTAAAGADTSSFDTAVFVEPSTSASVSEIVAAETAASSFADQCLAQATKLRKSGMSLKSDSTRIHCKIMDALILHPPTQKHPTKKN